MQILFRNRPRNFLLILCLALAFCLSTGTATAADTVSGDVLILHSYHQGYGWTDDIQTGIIESLGSKNLDLEIHTEYMDTKRFPPGDGLPWLADLYKRRYAGHPLDVVICSDDNAFNFVDQYGEQVFPGVPVVFCGTNYFDISRLENHPTWAGVSETANLQANLILIEELFPRVETIHFINDISTTGQHVHNELQKIIKAGQTTRTIIFHDGKTVSELEAVAAGLTRTDAVLFSLYFLDREGTSYGTTDVLERISDLCPAPIFGLWDFNLGAGIIGGNLTGGRFQGVSAGELASRIIYGEDPTSLPDLLDSPDHPVFDHAQLEKFNISGSQLPADSDIYNQPPSFLRMYRNTLLSGITVIAVLGCIVIALVLNLRHRQRSSQLLAESRKELELRVTERTRDLMETNQALVNSQQRMINSEKMASIGTLAAGVAHEINNPLGFISCNVTTLAENIDTLKVVLRHLEAYVVAAPEERLKISEKIEQIKIKENFEEILVDLDDMLEESGEGISRVQSIVKSLQVFSQFDSSSSTDVDLNNCLKCSLEVIGSELKERCHVTTDLEDLPLVQGNASDLGRAFANLLVNATQAIEEEGTIKISSRHVDDNLIIKIQDSGQGIPQDQLDRIFDPFYTTRDVGSGTGLGLAVVNGILDNHNATIEVDSEVGRGTTFRLVFKSSSDIGSDSTVELIQ